MEVTPGQMCEDLFSLLRRVKTAMMELADSHDLTPVQIAAMYTILEGHKTMGDVANGMHCDASNVTGIIDRLVAQGFVIRRESATDRRAKILDLTDKGQGVIGRIIVELPSAVGCQKLNATERITMHQVIGKISA